MTVILTKHKAWKQIIRHSHSKGQGLKFSFATCGTFCVYNRVYHLNVFQEELKSLKMCPIIPPLYRRHLFTLPSSVAVWNDLNKSNFILVFHHYPVCHLWPQCQVTLSRFKSTVNCVFCKNTLSIKTKNKFTFSH